MLLDRPIPGQSLTTRPGNATYERPPETVNAIDALDIHLDNLSSPETMEGVVNALENGVDLVSLTEALLRSAVLEGIHNLDVSILLAPLIHEYIKGEVDALGVDYDEGFEDKEADEKIRERAIGSKILRDLGIGMGKKSKEETTEPTPEPIQEEQPMQEEQSMEEEPKRGLMARTV